jgi:DNA-binding response OmpR family regulator
MSVDTDGVKNMEAVLSAFLLSTDPQCLFVVKHIFDHYAVRSTHCTTSSAAFETLKQKKFDLFVLDFDLRGVGELLSSETLSSMGRTSSVIALTGASSSLSDSLCRRARHVLDKPLTFDAMAGTLQSAYRRIFLEKRAYFRCAVRINASGSYQRNITRRPLENAVLQDISQTGLCLNTEEALPQGVKVFIDFQLPGTQASIHVTGNVIWSDRGRTGIQFSSIPPDEFDALRHWLNARCPWTPELPAKAINLPRATREHGAFAREQKEPHSLRLWSRPGQ